MTDDEFSNDNPRVPSGRSDSSGNQRPGDPHESNRFARRQFPVWLTAVLLATFVLVASISYFKSLGQRNKMAKVNMVLQQKTANDSDLPDATNGGPDQESASTRVTAPNIHFHDQSGKLVHLKDFRGKVVILSFWASWCGPCIEELPTFAPLVRKYEGKGLQMIALNVDNNQKAAKAFIADFWKKKDLPFSPFFDTDQSASTIFQVDTIPTTFVIDRMGKIAYSAFGANNWASPEADTGIAQLLSEKTQTQNDSTNDSADDSNKRK